MKVFSRDRRGAVSPADGLREELATLAEAARAQDCDAARRALGLRHQIGVAELKSPTEDKGFVEAEDASLGPDGLPEVSPTNLSAGVIRGAILERGCLLVRGLVDGGEAGRIALGIERALQAWDAVEEGSVPECGYFEPFEPDPRFELHQRSWIKAAGALWMADSPLLTGEICWIFDELGFARLAGEYLQERPLLSVQKGTLRKVVPGTAPGWHQDGQFLGSVKALNIWIALSRCGDVAPGMDLVPRRLDEIVETGTEGAPLDWNVAEDVVSDVAGERGVVRPIFNPGDALLFDEMFLHTTAAEATMPHPRYAIEAWLFGASRYPAEYAPLAL
jgi:hypothetical protein